MSEIIRYCNLNDNYRHGNQVFSPQGMSICLTEAMGAGGGHIPLIPIIRKINENSNAKDG